MQIDWEEMSKSNDLDSLTTDFSMKFKNVLDSIYPIQVIQTRNKYAAWLSTETKKLMSQRDTYRKRAGANRAGPDWEYFKFLRNKVVCHQEADLKEWNRNLLKSAAETKNPSAMYNGLSKD